MPDIDQRILDEYNSKPFEYIEHRLRAIKDYLVSAPIDIVATALHVSAINAILSANTAVPAHERGTLAVWDAITDGVTDASELAEYTNQQSPDGRHTVMYYRKKARYIHNNTISTDFVDLAATLLDEGVQACQQQLVHRVEGIKNRKAAFTLANLGFTSAACMDSIMENAFDVNTGTTDGRWDVKHPFSTVVTDRYYDRIDDLRAETPTASAQMDRYIWQWAAWSAHRDDGFTVHDPWFLLIDSILDP